MTQFNPTNVEVIRKAFDNISLNKWVAGDAALAEVPAGEQGGDTTSDVSLAGVSTIAVQTAMLAEFAGVSASALRDYRQVAAAWASKDRQTTASWSVHRELMSTPNKEKVLANLVKEVKRSGIALTKDYIRRNVKGIVPSHRDFLDLATEDKIAIAREVQADPDLHAVASAELAKATEERYQARMDRILAEHPRARDLDDEDLSYGVMSKHPTVKKEADDAKAFPTGTLGLFLQGYSHLMSGLLAMEEHGIKLYDLKLFGDIDELITKTVQLEKKIAPKFRAAFQDAKARLVIDSLDDSAIIGGTKQ